MNLPPYPRYKPSGVEWLRDVPEHWEVKPLKRELLRSSSGGGLIKGNMASEPEEGLFQGFSASGPDVWVDEAHYDQPGIVLSAVGARCGKAFKADGKWTAVANTHVFLPAHGRSRDYLWYVLNNEDFWDRGGTAQPYVRVPATLNRLFVFAPADEQQRIADFLEERTGKLDALAEKKRALIEKLKEKRSALIVRTVTKGLPAEAAAQAGLPTHPKLKPSGIDWLGDIPEHWKASRVGFLVTKIGSGKTPRGGAESYQNEGVMLIRSQNVYDEGLRLDDVAFIDDETDEEMAGTRVKPCDVLLNITGASLGRCSVVPKSFPRANVNQHVCIVRSEPDKVGPTFLQRALTADTVKAQIFADEAGSSREGLNFQQVRDFVVAVPPLTEQTAIADYLDRETAKIDRMIEKVEAAIEKLAEYRTALITAAVAGKIDVRKGSPTAKTA